MTVRRLNGSRSTDRKRSWRDQEIYRSRAAAFIGPDVRKAMMKKNVYRISLAVIALMGFGGMTALAQTKTQPRVAEQAASAQAAKQGQQRINHDILKIDMSATTNEPHRVLAMAFMQNIETFTKALGDQAQGGTLLSADFARAAVAEIRRNFDEAKTHHQEHVRTLLPGRPSRMTGMVDRDMRDSRLKDAIDVLDKDVQDYTLNSKRIAADCASVLKYLDEMAKLHSQE